jgi:hypothetical protein
MGLLVSILQLKASVNVLINCRNDKKDQIQLYWFSIFLKVLL